LRLGELIVEIITAIRMLRGVVYMTKSRGPRKEPWGTPQEEI